MNRSEYHKEYRQKQRDLIHAKLDMILAHLGIDSAETPKPAKPKKKEPIPLTPEILGAVLKAVDSMKAPCATCGKPATHIYDSRYFCEFHHGTNAKPI